MGLGVPEYDIEETGPDHAKTFTAWAVVNRVRHGGVQGRTKKEAEQRAARSAFLALTDDAPPDPSTGHPPGQPANRDLPDDYA